MSRYVEYLGQVRSFRTVPDVRDVARLLTDIHDASAIIADGFSKHMREDEQAEKRYARLHRQRLNDLLRIVIDGTARELARSIVAGRPTHREEREQERLFEAFSRTRSARARRNAGARAHAGSRLCGRAWRRGASPQRPHHGTLFTLTPPWDSRPFPPSLPERELAVEHRS
jgi:hypothetical protein